MSTLFSKILQLIDRRNFNNIVDRFDGDKHVRKLNCWDEFIILMFGQLNKCSSAREVVPLFNSYENKLYHLGSKEVARTTFNDALKNRDAQIYEALYRDFVEKEMMATLGAKHKELTTIIDATNIVLPCSSRKDFPASRDKSVLKVHTVYCLETQLPQEAYITSALVNDIVVAKQKIELRSGMTYVFDKGYYDFGWWWNIHQSGSKFVTRLKKHTSPIFIADHSTPEAPHILSDQLIQLKNKHGRKVTHPYAHNLRRVIIKDDKGGVLTLVTNDLERSAGEIAQLYKDRWSIELFFKWIKQNLKIKKFYGKSVNAMRTQIFVALITYVVMKRFARLNSIKGRFLDFIRMPSQHLMSTVESWWNLFFAEPINSKKERRKRIKRRQDNQLLFCFLKEICHA